MNETNENHGNGNGKLAAWQKRIDAAREKMAAEKERLREQRKRESEKLYRLVGEACCKAAGRDAGFGAALKAVLETETDQRAQAFLRERGMLV
jgi:hypothetical protein